MIHPSTIASRIKPNFIKFNPTIWNSLNQTTSTIKSPLGWLKRRSRLEKCLIAWTGILITIFLTSQTILIVLSNPSIPICETKDCVAKANELMRNMDESVNPCVDFYKFACGGFVNSTIIPSGMYQFSNFDQAQTKVDERLRIALEDLVGQVNEYKAFNLVGTLYQSCMDTDTIEKRGLEPVRKILEEIGWPALDKPKSNITWDENGFNWTDTIYRLHQLGLPTNQIFRLSVAQDITNTSRRIIIIDPPTLLPKLKNRRKTNFEGLQEIYNSEIRQIRLAKLLGANIKFATREIRNGIDFGLVLHTLTSAILRQSNCTFDKHLMIAQLEQDFNDIPWLEYINSHLPTDKIRVSSNEPILISLPEYLDVAINQIKKVGKRVLANYIIGSAISSMANHLNKLSRDPLIQLQGSTKDQRPIIARWLFCSIIVSTLLPQATGALYIRKYFTKEDRAVAQALWKDIQMAFVEILQDSDWMQSTTKQRALHKVELMIARIGYPDELLDDAVLTDYYQGLELDLKLHFENVLCVKKFDRERQSNLLRVPVNRTDWRNHEFSTNVNAFYDPIENGIEVSAIILQGSFFGKDMPKYVNYGAMGWILGHELTHGFDNRGSEFDAQGNFRDWWEVKTKELYQGRIQCMIEQYGNYTLERWNGQLLDGNYTVGENIADNGGIKSTYRAYGEWVGRNYEEKRLPGLNYDVKQLFWISAANVWCSKFSGDSDDLERNDVHSPPELRIKGSFSNMKQFSQDFGCPIGSPMNPLSKCSVW